MTFTFFVFKIKYMLQEYLLIKKLSQFVGFYFFKNNLGCYKKICLSYELNASFVFNINEDGISQINCLLYFLLIYIL